MFQATIQSAKLGCMQLNSLTGRYESIVVRTYHHPIRFSIHVELVKQLSRLEAFSDWLEINQQTFKVLIENQILDNDLVWDDVWDKILGTDWATRSTGFLSDYLTYNTVELSTDSIYVWIETAGLHSDHMVRATLNNRMEIQCCEMH